MYFKLIKKCKLFPVQVRASFWFLICSFLQKGISAITVPIFTRLLTTEEYGQYSVFNSWLGICSVFITLNLFAGVYTQGLIKYDKEQEVYSSSMQGLTLTLSAAWTVVYLLSRNFWNAMFSLTTIQVLAMFVMVWTSAVYAFWAAEQQVRYRYGILVAVTLASSVAKPLVGIFFVIHAEDKVTARILGLALVEVVCYTAFFFVQMFKGKVFFSGKFWKHALTFNLPLVPHYLSQTVLGSADRIMISNMEGESAAGIYSLAYSVSLIMTLFNSALSQTMSPWLYQKIKDRNISSIKKTAYMALVLIAGVNILLIAFAPEIVAIFAPASYYDAIWVIPPVAMSVYFMFSYDLFAKFEFYFERTKIISVATIFGAVLNIALNYIFITIFGYVVAGYTTLACYIVYALFHYVFMRKVCREDLHGEYPYDTKVILAISLFFLGIGFLFLFTYGNRWIRYAVIAACMVILIVKREWIVGNIRSQLDTKVCL